MQNKETNPLVAIACGGTGGHLFPGIAIADVLQSRGCDIMLLISPKEVDQQAVKSVVGMEIVTLPAMAMDHSGSGFLGRCWRSYQICLNRFRKHCPSAVLAMGSFTSAPPILAGKTLGAATFLHEANAIPGKANRLLSPLVDEVFAGFPMAAKHLYCQSVLVTGTPVRTQFRAMDPAACRMALGLQTNAPVLLVMGGSQGAMGVNELVRKALPMLIERLPQLQFLHLTGASDVERTKQEYQQAGRRAVVLPFLTEMELALGAATVAVSRSGASSLAEFAATELPAILIPYPHAADNHQFYNAKSLVDSGAARQLDQKKTTPEELAKNIIELVESQPNQDRMKQALRSWFHASAAETIADRILRCVDIASDAEASSEDQPYRMDSITTSRNRTEFQFKPSALQ